VLYKYTYLYLSPYLPNAEGLVLTVLEGTMEVHDNKTESEGTGFKYVQLKEMENCNE